MMYSSFFLVPPGEGGSGHTAYRQPRKKPYVFHVVPNSDERTFLEEQLDRAYKTISEIFGFATGMRVFCYDSQEALLRSPALPRIGQPDVLIVKSRRLMRAESEDSILGFERSTVSRVAAHKLLAAAANLLIARRGISVDPRRMDTFGHPLVPDWLDEAIPALCDDPEESQQLARWLLADAPGDVIPLKDLLTMRHPLSAEVAEFLVERRGTNPAEPQVLPPVSGLSPHAKQYSKQVYLLSRYLFDQEGPAFFGEAVARALEGASIEETLTSAKSVPRDIKELERAYLQYQAPDS